MTNRTTTPRLAQMFQTVKSSPSSPETASSGTMIHHKVPVSRIQKERIIYYRGIEKRYGVSSASRILSPQLFLKKYDYIRDCLKDVLGLTPGQCEVTVRLLRFWAYYGQAYPKEAQVSEEPGCSKATFWRTIRILKECGYIRVVNRFVLRPHAQISNLYRLDRLVILLAKYLAEHIAHIWPEWIFSVISKPWPELWSFLEGGQLKLPLLSSYSQPGV